MSLGQTVATQYSLNEILYMSIDICTHMCVYLCMCTHIYVYIHIYVWIDFFPKSPFYNHWIKQNYEHYTFSIVWKFKCFQNYPDWTIKLPEPFYETVWIYIFISLCFAFLGGRGVEILSILLYKCKLCIL